MNVRKGNKLMIVKINKEHPFDLHEIVKVVEVLPETCLYVKSTTRNMDGFIIEGEYVHFV